MNVVVTGSEGFLGRSVVARLAAEGLPVIAVDRVAHEGDPLPNVHYHQSDLSAPVNLLPERPAINQKSKIKNQNFTLIHLAWDMRRHQGFEIQAEQVRQFAALLDYWQNRGLEKVIAMGSAEEYGPREGILSEEDQPEFPLSPYGWAKRAARGLAASWSAKTECPLVWLRPFIIYGPGQKGDMLIPSAVAAARTRQAAAFTDGQQRRDFVFSDDVVEAIVLSNRHDLSGFQEFNLGRGEEVRVADVLTGIARQFDAESCFQLGARPRRPGEPEVQVADVRRSREVLGWEARVGIAEGLQKLRD